MEVKFEFLIDRNLSPVEQGQQLIKQFMEAADKHLADWQAGTGKRQVEHGKLRAEIADTFPTLFTQEQQEKLEADIQRLKLIKDDKKFRAETLRLMTENYLLGLFKGLSLPPEDAERLLKRTSSTEGNLT